MSLKYEPASLPQHKGRTVLEEFSNDVLLDLAQRY